MANEVTLRRFGAGISAGSAGITKAEPVRALEYLQSIYRDPLQPEPVRMRAAKECLPFETPKLAVTGYINEAGSFAEALDRAIARSQAGRVTLELSAEPPAPAERSVRVGRNDWEGIRMQKFIAWLGSLSWPGRAEAPQPSSSPPPTEGKVSVERTELSQSVECSLPLHPAIAPPSQLEQSGLRGPHPILLGTVTTYDPSKCRVLS